MFALLKCLKSSGYTTTTSTAELVKQHLEHDGLTHILWADELLSLEEFSDTIHASDTYSKGSKGRQAYIDGQLLRLHRVFLNLYSFRSALKGPTLDVASGWGILYPAFKKFLSGALPYSVAEMSGWEGLEIDGDKIDGCKFHAENSLLPHEDLSIGTVCFFDCIEHLIVDPIWPLLEFNRVLQVGGRLVISTPNASTVSKIFQIAQGGNPATESEIRPSSIYQRHNREWTPIELKQALECCGFGNFHYTTNSHLLAQYQLDLLVDMNSKGLIGKPYQYFGPELFIIAEKLKHVTLDSDLPTEQRWPAWLYTEFDAYRKRPKVFPIIVSDDYA